MKGECNIEEPDESQRFNNHNHPFFTKYAPHHSDALMVASEQHSSKKPKINTTTTCDDVATVEVTQRPRGRPAGSKNKPKPPIVINREPEPAMSPYILEVPSGSDIIGSLTRFTRRRGMGICVLNASGSVSNVTLKQPSTSNRTGGGTVTFHGRFDILSLSAVLLLETVPFLHDDNNNNDGFGFSITLGGPQGQIFGGKVVEPLIAVTTVYVIATSFNCHNYQRLPGAEDEERVVENVTAGGGDGHCGLLVSRGGNGGHVGPTGGVGGGADVMWGPTSKPPLPPPY